MRLLTLKEVCIEFIAGRLDWHDYTQQKWQRRAYLSTCPMDLRQGLLDEMDVLIQMGRCYGPTMSTYATRKTRPLIELLVDPDPDIRRAGEMFHKLANEPGVDNDR